MSLFGSIANISTLGGYGAVQGLLQQPDDPGKKQLAQLLGQIDDAKLQSAAGFDRAAATERRSLPMVTKSFDDANANTLALAQGTKKTVMQNQGAQIAKSDMQLDQSGFGGSNLSTLAHQGVYGDTTRALNSIDQMFSSRFGDIATRKAQAVGGINADVANLQAQGTGNLVNQYDTAAKAIGDVQYVPKKSLLDLLGQGASIAGSLAAL